MQDFISVSDVAKQCGRRKASIFKILNRLRIQPEKRRSPERHGQIASYISREEFEIVLAEIQGLTKTPSAPEELVPSELGEFYVILLESERDPGRFKVGFTSNIAERLRAHRTAAPFAKVLKTWPCRVLWEKTAIACVADSSERLHTKVFRTDSIQEVIEKCDAFFSLMPQLIKADEMN